MAKAILGGLLSGAGKGLVARGQNQREEAAAMREAALERARERREREFTREQNEADREHQRGLLSETKADERGRLYGITKGGDQKDLGIRVPKEDGTGSGSGGLMSASDKRLWDAAIQRHTTESIDGKKTDWDAVATDLRQKGREDLAQMAASPEGSAIDVESPEWRKAEEQARAEAESRNPVGPDFIRPGGMKEAYGDLSEEEWVNRRTREIYEELTGRGSAAGGGRQRQGSGQEERGGDRGTDTGGGGSGRGEQAQSGQRADAQPLPTKNGKIDASQLVEGQIYDTPKGLARYLGNGDFETVD